MSTPVSLTRIPAEAPAAAGSDWVSPALVALALLAWLGSVTVFVTHPLSELPLYFAQRFLVLDATSLLFVLLIISSILPPEADLVNLLLPFPRRADRSSDRAEDAARRAARCLGGSDDGTAREMLIWTDDDDDGLLASGWTEGPRP